MIDAMKRILNKIMSFFEINHAGKQSVGYANEFVEFCSQLFTNITSCLRSDEAYPYKSHEMLVISGSASSAQLSASEYGVSLASYEQ